MVKVVEGNEYFAAAYVVMIEIIVLTVNAAVNAEAVRGYAAADSVLAVFAVRKNLIVVVAGVVQVLVLTILVVHVDMQFVMAFAVLTIRWIVLMMNAVLEPEFVRINVAMVSVFSVNVALLKNHVNRRIRAVFIGSLIKHSMAEHILSRTIS